MPFALTGCNEGYSPNTYASNAAQEEAAVQRGVIVGVRQVMISADGTIGAATGAAAGGAAGSQVAGAPVVTALGAIGGTLVGGISGTVAAHAVNDMKGWEYIVEETPDGKLVSVTQTSKVALGVGTHVLVIAGAQQARIVPDYTVAVAVVAPAPAKAAVVVADPPKPVPAGAATMEINVAPVLPATGAAPGAPVTVASDPAASAPAPAEQSAAAAPAAAGGVAGTGPVTASAASLIPASQPAATGAPRN